MTPAEQDDKVVEDALRVLIEHFDTAQVFVTRHDPDGTTAKIRGRGNYYARRGQIQEWVENERAASDEEVRQAMTPEE